MFQKNSDEQYVAPQYDMHAADEVETVVGPSVQVEGDFVSEGNIVVKGIVSGSVKTSRLLRVEEGAKILAHVRAGNAVVSGHIKGNMRVEDTLELTASAQILGDIICRTLAVAPGALIHGKVSMNGVEDIEEDKQKRSPRKKRSAGDDDMKEGDDDDMVM